MRGIMIPPEAAMYMADCLDLLIQYVINHPCPEGEEEDVFEATQARTVADLILRSEQLKHAVRLCRQVQEGTSNDN